MSSTTRQAVATKSVRTIAMSLAAASLASSALASTTTYSSRTEFEAALASIQVETFTGDALSIPGLSYSSTQGEITGNQFFDYLTGSNDTTWHFSTAITAFGGNWDLTPNGPGTGIQFLLNGTKPVSTGIPSSYAGEFFGIVSTEPFTSVTYGGGSETYTMDNLTIGAVPEPETYAMMMAGLGLLGFSVRRRRSNRR